ncbi:kinesin-like protein 98A isoform X1 [Tachypleus tridentatus]|uniref:kinesin-like protein 98A isoform X1 n=2 Tax=Tachypleus tridentatus TaxID=6853 RepID=UPI003FD2E94C
MASVKVAVRVRPFNQREIEMNSELIIQMEGQTTRIINPKISATCSEGDGGRERIKTFTFDHSYWSFDDQDERYVGQEKVFEDLGKEVIENAFEGYNTCIFAYGQTSSGKTFTMMGTPGFEGLIPRICEAMFSRMKSKSNSGTTFRTEVSYLEIYNEKVKDLLKKSSNQHSLRVREHPKFGPYVQDLSHHLVMDFSDVQELMTRGNSRRTTASTAMNDVSSRSHAIFTLTFIQATFHRDMPSETVSKVNLVDLAGSERVASSGATGQRLKEGAHINKSLVTLGTVISALADTSSNLTKKQAFIPYRDSVLTWLLKDSLGGNTKTMMIATISPALCNYGESLSTLRYANRAKNIINRPTINEDPNVKLIRELRKEIAHLKELLGESVKSSPMMVERIHENEARVKVLTEEWTGKWKETQKILKEQRTLGLRKSGLGVVLDSELPHLVGIDDDLLSTGITLYHLQEGKALIGTQNAPIKQDIVLNGVEVEDQHCIIELENGKATLIPLEKAQCFVNNIAIDSPTKLSHGCVILLGLTNMFRFNDPAEVERLRKEKEKGATLNLPRLSLLSRSTSDLARSVENLNSPRFEIESLKAFHGEELEIKRKQIQELEDQHRIAEAKRQEEQEILEEMLEQKLKELAVLQEKNEELQQQLHQSNEEMSENERKLDSEKMNREKELIENIQEVNQKLEELRKQEKDYLEAFSKARQLLKERKAELFTEVENQRQKLMEEWKHVEDYKSKELQLKESKETELREERETVEWLQQQKYFQAELQAKQLKLLQCEMEILEDAETMPITSSSPQNKEEETSFNKYKDKVEEVIADHEKYIHLKLHDFHQQVAMEKDRMEDLRRTMSLKVLDLQQRTKNMDPTDLETDFQYTQELSNLEEERSNISKEQSKILFREALIEDMFNTELEFLKSNKQKLLDEIPSSSEMKELAFSKYFEQRELENKICSLTKKLSELVEQHKKAFKDTRKEEIKFNRKKDIVETVQQREQEEIKGKIQLVQKLENKEEDLERKERETLEDIENLKARLKEIELSLQSQIATQNSSHTSVSETLINQTDGENGCGVYATVRTDFFEEQTPDCNLLVESEHDSIEKLRSHDGISEELQRKLMEIKILEVEYTTIKQDLEEKNRAFEQERQYELDHIEVEKFHLQELEHQERINILVEQEVQRRLFEEQLRKEYLLHEENLQERSNREKELNTIRNYHEKELKHIRQRLEINRSASPVLNNFSPDRTASAATNDLVETNQEIKISIPSYTMRGSGGDAHYEYEVKVNVNGESWTICRRYKRFRELHHFMKLKYGDKMKMPYFPPRRMFGSKSEKVVEQRKVYLQAYLQNLVSSCMKVDGCPLNQPSIQKLCKQNLWDFASFFKKGVFESSKHSTG